MAYKDHENSQFFELDILGQQPLLQIYTQLCFCFPLNDVADEPRIRETLQQGLTKLTNLFPWVGGHIINEGASNASTGVYKIKLSNEKPIVIVKDLKSVTNAPTFSELKKSEFPIRLLDEDLIAPKRTLPGGPNWSASDLQKVFLIQINFLDGGLIITFNGQHASMDMSGQAEIIRLLNKCCKGEIITEEELEIGNMSRTELIPKLSNDYKFSKELEEFIMDPGSFPTTEQLMSLPKANWCYYSFNIESITSLKKLASADLKSGFVSSDDSLTAFVWQSVTRARSYRLKSDQTTSIGRAVDLRNTIGLPSSYSGILQSMVHRMSTVSDIVKSPLGVIASNLRSDLDDKKLTNSVRELATLIDREPDRSHISLNAKLSSSTDVQISSWSKIQVSELDFGLGLGKPESVRRPYFTPCESLIYFMPKTLNGEVTVAICLRDEDLLKLNEDELFLKYGRHIG